MVITYPYRTGLYVNLTNRCPCACEFCLRRNGPGVNGTDSLWLEREPTVEEVLADLDTRNLDDFSELVFCGYGEPTERLDVLLAAARHAKAAKPDLKVRINTNGLSDLIHGEPTAPRLKGLVDAVSVSLNASDPEQYLKICHPKFGRKSWQAVIDFAQSCKVYVPDVVMTIVDSPVTTPEEQAKCRAITDRIGVRLRIRAYENPDPGASSPATPAWSVLPEEWKPLLTARGLRAFRADQILQALYRDYITDWDQATTLPKDFRETLKREFPILPAEEIACDTAPDGTKKLLLKMNDGELVETVVIPVFAKGEGGGRETVRLTQCVSSQIGCAMGCAFCASGAKGIVRSLRADEIVAEVMAARKYGTLTNLVVMGMGEPFANYDETMRALKLINAGKGPNLGARHITLSTCGVVPGFARLAAEGLQFELSVSLHAPDDKLRDELMPVNRKWPLAELMAACRDYTLKTKRIITFEYTVIKGVNDSRDCAEALARRVREVPMAKVNLIPLSPVDHRPDFQTPPESTMLMFLDVLMKNHVQTMIRRSRGKERQAACGQLRLRHLPGVVQE